MIVDTYGRPEGGIPGLKEIGTPEDNQQNQIAWTLGALRDGTTNQRTHMG